MFFGILTETMDLQLANMLSGIKVMRDGTLKLVKMQPKNAYSPMLSMPCGDELDID